MWDAVGVLIARTGGDSERFWKDCGGEVDDLILITRANGLFQEHFLYLLLYASWLFEWADLVHSYSIAISNCALKATSLTSACECFAHYSQRL